MGFRSKCSIVPSWIFFQCSGTNIPSHFLSSVPVVVVGHPASLRVHALVEHMTLPIVIAKVQGFAIVSLKSPNDRFFSFLPWGINLLYGDDLQLPLPPFGRSDVQRVIQLSNLAI